MRKPAPALFALALFFALAQAAPGDPVFSASFDKGLKSDIPAAVAPETKGGCLLVGGLKGQGLRLEENARIAWPVDYNPEQGAIAFWMRPEWEKNDTNRFSFFSIPLVGGYFDCYRSFWGQYRFIQFRLVQGGDKIVDKQYSGDLAPRVWHHFALTWNKGSGMKLHIDGKAVATVEKTWIGEGRETKPLAIEHRSGAGGVLDEFKVWDRELSLSEVERLAASLDFAAAPATALPAPLLSIPFDENLNAAMGGRNAPGDAGVRVTFVDGVEGRGGLVKRWAYDQKASLSYPGVALPPRASLRFHVKPMWGDTAPRYEILNLLGGESAVECFKDQGRNLVLRFKGGAASDRLEAENPLKNNEWNRVVLWWDAPAGTFGWVVNDQAQTGAFKEIRKTDGLFGRDVTLWVGSRVKNNFESESADAAFDELALYPVVLPTGEAGAFFRRAGETGGLATLVPDVSKAARQIATGALAIHGTDLAFYHREGHTGSGEWKADGKGRTLILRTVLAFASNESRGLALRVKTKGMEARLGYDPATGAADILCEDGEKSFKLKTLYPLRAGDTNTLAIVWEGAEARLFVGAVPQASAAHGGLLPGPVESIQHPAGKARVQEAALLSKPLSAGDLIALENAWAPPVPAPAARSATEASWWSPEGAPVRATATRRAMGLNGTWAWLPETRALPRPPRGESRYSSPIPGRWINARGKRNISPRFTTRDASGKEVLEVDGRSLQTVLRGWYGRRVETKPGERAFLRLPYVGATCARIFANGLLVDTFAMENPFEQGMKSERLVDLGRQTGGECALDVELFFENEKFAGGVSLIDLEWEQNAAGILACAPVVRTSVSRGRIDVSGRLLNFDGRKGAVTVSAVIRARGSAAIVKTLPTSTLALSGGREAPFQLSAPWTDAQWWSPDRPGLYALTLQVRDASGALLDESHPASFGFREFAFGSNQFLLNGKRFHLFYNSGSGDSFGLRYDAHLDPARARLSVAAVKACGYNAILIENQYNKDMAEWYTGKSPTWQDNLLDACDELGMAAILLVPEYDEFTREADYRLAATRILEWSGNHPSVLLYLNDFNKTHYALCQHPAMVNDYAYKPRGREAARRNILKGDAVWASIDPTREIFHNAGGNLTKLYTTMHYMSFGLPLQEREDWPSQWLRTNLFMDSEFGLPYAGQFLDFDQSAVHRSKFLLTEHAARFLGDGAYDLSTEGHGRMKGLFEQMWVGNEVRPDFLAVKTAMASNHLRAWRGWDTSGIGIFAENAATFYKTGPRDYLWSNDLRFPEPKAMGVKPDAIFFDARYEDVARPGAYQGVLARALEAVKVHLIHEAPDWNGKDHAYFAGEAVGKQALVLNDRSTELRARLTLRAFGGGAAFALQTNVVVAPGEQARIPLRFQAPATDRKLRLQIEARLEAAGASSLDQLEIQVFPREAAPRVEGVGLYDPRGLTTRAFAAAGIPFRKVASASDVQGLKLLVVGSETLAPMADPLLGEVESRGFLDRGLALLVFEQRACNLGNLIYEEERQRRVFTRQAGHPALAGLDETDLRDWRGGSALASILDKPDIKRSENSPHYPFYKYTCGSAGIVSSFPMRIPSGGGWLPLLACGFDLVNSPLLEQRRGKGRVVLCQLDVTRRYGIDPVATKLVHNLLSWLGSAPALAQSPGAVYDPSGRFPALVGANGLKRLPSLEALPAEGVVLAVQVPAPELEAARAKIADFVARGGTFIHQGRLPDGAQSWTPMAVRVETQRAFRARALETPGTLFAGLGNNDLYFRRATNASVFDAAGARALSEPKLAVEIPHGKGRLALLGVDPRDLAVDPAPKGDDYVSFIDHFTALKPARWANALLANAGASLAQPLFGLKRYLHNRQSALDAELPIETWKFRIDPDDLGVKAGWHSTPLDREWAPIETGISWEDQGYTMTNKNLVYTGDQAKNNQYQYDGVAWYRAEFALPESAKSYALFRLLPGIIDDFDEAFVNGSSIGATGKETPRWWTVERSYEIPKALLKFGQKNTLAIRVYDQYGGGLVKGPVRLAMKVEGGETPDPSPYPADYPKYDVNAFHNW